MKRRPLLPEPGDLISDHYRVRDVIGRGGMGVVLLATDERLEREVAIKMIRPDRLASQMTRLRFLTEARALARVDHPNVTRVHAFGELGGLPYFVMEHVPGPNLDDLLIDGWFEDRPIEETLRVVEEVGEGLAAIHAAGLTHGDLKPSNIIMGRHGRVTITDMGLARLLASADVESGSIWGTPEYIAPELAHGRRVPPHLLPRSDVYSLAVITYELLTGRLPFEHVDRHRIAEMHASEPPPPASRARRDLGTEFDSVLARGLEKDPRWRTQTGPRFATMLRKAASVAQARLVRFLVADDNPDQRTLLSELLARRFPGAVVEAAPDGHAALAAAELRPPTVAIVDLDMPRMNGVELTAALRGLPQTRDTSIVVMTGVGASKDWEALSRMGVDHFLVKPVRPAQLVSVLRPLAANATPRKIAAPEAI